jgi:hypothetical protein
VFGVWCLVFGVWCLVFGVWCLVFGVWCLVFGVWCLVFGCVQKTVISIAEHSSFAFAFSSIIAPCLVFGACLCAKMP